MVCLSCTSAMIFFLIFFNAYSLLNVMIWFLFSFSMGIGHSFSNSLQLFAVLVRDAFKYIIINDEKSVSVLFAFVRLCVHVFNG